MKVYVVTKDCYRDYEIITATIDKKMANKIAKRFGARVSAYDPELYMKPVFFVRFAPDGDVINVYDESGSAYYYKCINECDFDCRCGGNYIYAVVQSDNEEDAIKIASELRIAFLKRKSKEKDNDD